MFDASSILGQMEKLEEEQEANKQLYQQSHLDLAGGKDGGTELEFIHPDEIPLDELDIFDEALDDLEAT